MREPPRFEEFFEEQKERLLRILSVVTGSRAEAEDLAQEAFTRVFERWSTVGSMADPAGYLHRTAMNAFRNQYRRARVALGRAVGLGPEQDVFKPVEDRDVAARALGALTPRQRAALVLTEALGYSGEEAGHLLGIKADGRWVAYEGSGPQGIGLWVVGASQEPRRVATDTTTWIWSSTGAHLATMEPVLDFGFSGASLSTIDPVTGETTDLGTISERIGDVTSAPALSSDGTRFVFGARGGALYSVDARSGARSLLVRPGEDLDSVDVIHWSPDGAHIAVMNDLEPGGGRLYVTDADGSHIRVLTETFEYDGVAWSPDGTRLAYVDASGSDQKLWVASMDDSPPIEIGSPPAVSCGDLLCEDDLTWSPDGSPIAFRSASGGSVDVAAIDADGRGDVGPIDDLTYRSWDGGWYSCECP